MSVARGCAALLLLSIGCRHSSLSGGDAGEDAAVVVDGATPSTDGATIPDAGGTDLSLVAGACLANPAGPFYAIDAPDEIAVTHPATAIQIFDADGDGKLDLVYSDNQGMLQVLRQSSARTFASETSIANGCTSGSNDALLVGDFDKDGVSDLVVPCDDFSGGTEVKIVSFLKGQKGGGFEAPTSMMSPPVSARASVVADLDQDGTLDAVILDDDPAGVAVYWGGPSFATTAPYLASAGLKGKMTGIATAPLGADGVPDLVVAYGDGSTKNGYQVLRMSRPASERTLTAATSDLIDRGTTNEPLGVALGYLDSDKRPDLVGTEVGTTLYGSVGTAGSGGITTFGAVASLDSAFKSPNILPRRRPQL